MKLYTRPASLIDALALAPTLREADVREISAALNQPPDLALANSLKGSTEATAICEYKGRLLALFGVAEVGNQVGLVWMLASNNLLNHRFEFLRRSREHVRDLLTRYSLLYNWTDSRNVEHHRWIEWCGFKFTGRSRTISDPLVPFLEFSQNVCT